ncbi:hypothetical protein IKT18_03795 [Candidatus Saccharibacteria bacterium]|nr:hypothetical protein [Candidatus Saccharibacteria bacterium]
MSILQEYENHVKYIGRDRINAIDVFSEERGLFYSDIVYSKEYWDEFDKWYKTIYNNRYGKSTRGDKKV